MIGPVMIGPSSSHTAGVVRIGRVARKILGAQPEFVDIVFYNSFARTYEGHGSDRAIIAGVLDFKTDDTRIKTAFDHAKEAGLKFSFKSMGNASTMHPNTVRVNLGTKDRQVEIVGESRGGGIIKITEIDGFSSNFSANLHTLIIMADDRPGAIAFVANVLANDECNIATMSVNRKGKRDIAFHVIEMDSPMKEITLTYLENLSWVRKLVFIPDIEF